MHVYRTGPNLLWAALGWAGLGWAGSGEVVTIQNRKVSVLSHPCGGSVSLAALHGTVGASLVDEIRFAYPLNAVARWSVEGKRSRAPITIFSPRPEIFPECFTALVLF